VDLPSSPQRIEHAAALFAALVIASLPALLAGLACGAPRGLVVGFSVSIAIGVLGLHVLVRLEGHRGLPRAQVRRQRRGSSA
jgi:fatty acid desaturase